LRRIKTVGVSIPAVAGPFTNVNCTVALQSSTVRISSQLANGACGRDPANPDPRFTDYFGSVETVVTSGATNDSGMFETNLHDDRFLPFEGAGALSTWSLSLPSSLRPFDYTTISDVILHIRYTARDGGTELATQASKELQAMLATASPDSGCCSAFATTSPPSGRPSSTEAVTTLSPCARSTSPSWSRALIWPSTHLPYARAVTQSSSRPGR
jgi:hypothetical protein